MLSPLLLLPLLALSLLMAACTPVERIHEAPFGTLPDGRAVTAFTLRNVQGLEAQVLDLGGIITSLHVPDRDGHLGDITLGYDHLDGYLDRDQAPYFGALIGRFGNRIARGRFTLDGQTYALATNNGANHLHGGQQGFDQALWHAAPFQTDTSAGLILTHTSPDGDEGYPGTLDVRVTYTLADDNSLTFAYHATTDRATPVNLTQHAYFNLEGEGQGDIRDHLLTLHASHFVPVDSALIPTGALAPVAGTPFDFQMPTVIGERIDDDHPQVRYGTGYDHTFVVDGPAGTLRPAAAVYAPGSGRVMAVETTEPGVQLYTGNVLDGRRIGKAGVPYGPQAGFCLETQHFPDSPNQPAFPNTILRPGEVYQSQTVLRFFTRPADGA